MNVKRFLSDSYRRKIDSRIDKIVINYKVSSPRRAQTTISKTRELPAFTEPENSSIININHAKAIYQEKCQDLRLRPNQAAESRFVEQFMSSIQNKSLRFNGLGLGPRCIAYIADLLLANPQFVVLDLSLNRLGDKGAETLGEFLADDTPLVALDLRSNSIGIEGASKLLQGLKNNTHITSIDLSTVDGIDRNRIGNLGCQSLAGTLAINQTISHLNASMCGVTADGCRYLGAALLSNSSLVVLDLSSNRFGSTGANNLFAMDGSLGMIETLSLARNGITDTASSNLCRQIHLSHTLKSLDLSENKLSLPFLRKLMEALGGDSSIESLNLSNNKFDESCSEALHLLIRDYQLKKISIANNPLKERAMIEISDAIAQNNSLISIDFSSTGMGDGGANALAKALQEQPTIQKVIITSNRIKDGVCFGRMLKVNQHISVLNLRNNELTDETGLEILEALKVNPTIADIDLTYNDFSYRCFVQIIDGIEHHKQRQNMRTAGTAERHVEWLKSEENRLFVYQSKIKEETAAVAQKSSELSARENELKELKEAKGKEIEAAELRLDEVKSEYEKVVDQRREAQQSMNNRRAELEMQHGLKQNAYTTASSKRQVSVSKFKKAEEKKRQAEREAKDEIAQLELQLSDAIATLKAVINDNLTGRKLIEEAAAEEAQKETGEAETSTKKKTKKKKSKKIK